jgi:hypothetical protein
MAHPERRRFLLHLLIPSSAVLMASACSGLGGPPGSYTISAAQLQDALTARVPRHHSIAGLLDLEARITGLRFLPEENRVAAQVGFEAGGPLLPRSFPGRFELLFAPRFEPSDSSLRASRLQVQGLSVPGLPSAFSAPLERSLPVLARLVAGEDLVLHQFRAADLRRLKSMGIQPGDIQVTPQGLQVGVAPRRAG